MHDESNDRQRRGPIQLLTLLITLALLAGAVTPAVTVADGKRDRHTHESAERLHEAEAQLAKWKLSGVHAQVVGGRAVPQGADTFMAFVLFETDDGIFQCGGSLIDPSFILTAAHCVDDGTGDPLPPSAFTVFIGKADLNQLDEANVRGVSHVFQDPDWNPDTFEDDVALLELDQAVPESIATVLPIVGAGDTRFDGAGQPVSVAGWGTTAESGSTTDQLRQADLNIVSNASCAGSYGSDFRASTMICAASAGRDSCQGDSGGPLFAKAVVDHKQVKKKGKKHRHHKRQTKTKSVPIYQDIELGIVSWGNGCARPAFPGVYTRLSSPEINTFITDVLNS
jgi:secreted trypsin-like serine protease